MRSVTAGALPARGSQAAMPARKAVTKQTTIEIAHTTRKTSTSSPKVKTDQKAETKPKNQALQLENLKEAISRDIGEAISPLMKIEKATYELATIAIPANPVNAKRMKEHIALLKEIVTSLTKLSVTSTSEAEHPKVLDPEIPAGKAVNDQSHVTKRPNVTQPKPVVIRRASSPSIGRAAVVTNNNDAIGPLASRIRMSLPVSNADNPQLNTVVKGSVLPSLTFIQDPSKIVGTKGDPAYLMADWLKARLAHYPGRYTFSIKNAELILRGSGAPADVEIWLRYAPLYPEHLLPNMITQKGDGLAWRIKCRIHPNFLDGQQGTIQLGSRRFKYQEVKLPRGKDFAQRYRIVVGKQIVDNLRKR